MVREVCVCVCMCVCVYVCVCVCVCMCMHGQLIRTYTSDHINMTNFLVTVSASSSNKELPSP